MSYEAGWDEKNIINNAILEIWRNIKVGKQADWYLLKNIYKLVINNDIACKLIIFRLFITQ